MPSPKACCRRYSNSGEPDQFTHAASRAAPGHPQEVALLYTMADTVLQMG